MKTLEKRLHEPAMIFKRSAAVIRPMTLDDLNDAQALQRDAYPSFLVEDALAFSSRITHENSYCLVAIYREKLLAYLLAHAWRSNSPPALDEVLGPVAKKEVLFIHDLAVAPTERGSGIGRRLFTQAMQRAVRGGLRRAQLIAVSGAAPYWKRLGFAEIQASSELASRVAKYGRDACIMERTFDPKTAALR
ncbi:MAG: GNAT family N-acetyltransferase [Alteraurantiacibacter sp. bin_em_oilr2.035]|nr:GNAT family N-acetyltransferase [Alteraurantiacibacter sp. bin_em_oilr2.035]